MTVSIQENPFDVGVELNKFSPKIPDVGAVVSFTGIVRSETEDPIDRLVIEHYPKMTERAIQEMIISAQKRWNIGDCLIIHRFGELFPSESIMMVAVQSRHRFEAFEAARFLMDYLKSRAPFWKKEFRGKKGRWVEGKAEDEAEFQKWNCK